MQTTTRFFSGGFELDLRPESFGELLRSDDILDDPAALRERLAQEGYLYIPGFFDREGVRAARAEFIRRLESFGGLDPAFPPGASRAFRQTFRSPSGINSWERGTGRGDFFGSPDDIL